MKPDMDTGDDAELHAYVDGRLDAQGRARVQELLAGDAEAARKVADWARQKELLRGLHAQVLAEPAPAPLLHAARQFGEREHAYARWRRWGGMAAAVLLAFGLGWIGHGQWRTQQLAGGSAPSQAFGRQALVAHAVYVPEVRHPVEVEAAQQEHLVQWLSKRLGRTLKVPQLGEQGFELVGGRLLPGDLGARAQFMYQNAAGERITLYVGAVDAADASSRDTAFGFTADGPTASFYWVDRGFGYALSGKLPKARLMQVSEAVYRQL
jgi:anti-sigma factor RsiW